MMAPPRSNDDAQPFRLYNTLTRSVEPFAPADRNTVRLYSCGPTVYNPAHVGNFRTFLFNDLLRRALRLRGWNVVQVQNLTDVDDKIIHRASDQARRRLPRSRIRSRKSFTRIAAISVSKTLSSIRRRRNTFRK